MFRFDEGLKVYLHREPVDFRLSIKGLAVLVEQALDLDPFASCAYGFSNRRRHRLTDSLPRESITTISRS
jgi:transposase